MKLSTDQLITWFFTASVAAGMHRPDDEGTYREMLSKIKGKERAGISSGVKQGVNDLLHMADMMPLEQSESIEAALAARALPSLRKMKAALSRKHIGILKRGLIRNEEEYYIVAEMLSDTSSDLTAAQRRSLGSMTAKYEFKTETA